MMEISSVDCPKCGAGISDQVRQGKLFKCSNCGSTLVWPESQSKLVLSFGIRLCPECGIENEQSRNFCRNCGVALTKICDLCKTRFYIGDSFCPNGHNYELIMEPQSQEIRKKAEGIIAQANDAYDKGKDLEKVLSICESALTIAPDLADAHFLKGIVLEDLGEWDDAIIAYQNVMIYDPTMKREVESAIHEIESTKKKWRG